MILDLGFMDVKYYLYGVLVQFFLLLVYLVRFLFGERFYGFQMYNRNGFDCWKNYNIGFLVCRKG